MKVVHLCLACFYPDGYSYQENMLPKYHARMGLETAVIASLVSFDENGQHPARGGKLPERVRHPVTRLAYREICAWPGCCAATGTYEALEKEARHLLSGLQFLDIGQVVRYLKAILG